MPYLPADFINYFPNYNIEPFMTALFPFGSLISRHPPRSSDFTLLSPLFAYRSVGHLAPAGIMIAAKSPGGGECQGLRPVGRSLENNGQMNNLSSRPRGEWGREEGRGWVEGKNCRIKTDRKSEGMVRHMLGHLIGYQKRTVRYRGMGDGGMCGWGVSVATAMILLSLKEKGTCGY